MISTRLWAALRDIPVPIPPRAKACNNLTITRNRVFTVSSEANPGTDCRMVPGFAQAGTLASKLLITS